MIYKPTQITLPAKRAALGRVLCAFCALLVIACSAEARQAKKPAAKARPTQVAKAGGRQAAPKPEPMQYGPFSIDNVRQFQSAQSKGTGKVTVKIDGPNLSIKSSRYDIAAPHMTLNLTKATAPGGKASQLRAQTATATGGATVVFRNPDQDETTTVTCDRANYTATDAEKNLGRLTMTGNVRSVTRGQAYGDVPLVQTWKTFTVEFVDADTIVTSGEVGNISGAIKEPAPRPKSGAAAGAPKQ